MPPGSLVTSPSFFGVVVVASWETGVILDVEALSKHCQACSRKGHLDPTFPEFLDWWEGHQAVCCINYTGSSNAMEKDGAVRIWERSVEKYKLRYTSMISDADSSTYLTSVMQLPMVMTIPFPYMRALDTFKNVCSSTWRQ